MRCDLVVPCVGCCSFSYVHGAENYREGELCSRAEGAESHDRTSCTTELDIHVGLAALARIYCSCTVVFLCI
jgi:hypothetical protein